MRGLLGSIVGKDTTSADSPASWFVDWVRGGEPTLSGIAVTPDSGMQFAPVWTCIRVRSEDLGKLPCFLYRRLKDGGKERATDHPSYTLIHDQPNPFQTALEFKQLLQAWCDLRGNGYALKEYDVRGQLIALWPLNPKWITVLRVPETWELFYHLNIPYMPEQTVPAEAILHLRGLTLDGYVGVSPITYHRETIGLGIAAEKYGAAFFGNSAQPQGVLKVPAVLAKGAGDLLRAEWEQKYRGVENAKKLAILDGGMEWVQTGMDNADAQYLESRKFQNHQIYSIYRVPPHKAGELGGATHSNIEHQGLEYISDCLMTEMVRWEQTLKRDLLTAKDIADGYFFEFLADALLRSDQKTRYEAYAIGRNWGWLSVNDIRERENMNRVPNGDIRLEPLNMIEAGTPRPLPGATPAKPPGSTPATQTPGSDPEAPTPDVSGASISPDGARYLLAMAQTLVARVEAEIRDQSRVPAGSPDGGQFAPGGGGGDGDNAGGQSATPATDLYTPPTKTADELVAESGAGTAAAITAVQERIAGGTPTDALVSAGGFKNPDGTYTAERQAVHERILGEIFSPEKIAAATPPDGTPPEMTMLGGRGGSGKSWLTEHGPVDGSKSILLDADAMKSQLPGYAGWNAALYHEESSDMIAMADQRALALGINVIHDATLKTESSAAKRMAAYQAAGFAVNGYYMYASPETATSRALSRFSKGGTFQGRFVPPAVILGNTQNERNFDKLSKGMKKWAVYDNDKAGGKPRLVASSK